MSRKNHILTFVGCFIFIMSCKKPGSSPFDHRLAKTIIAMSNGDSLLYVSFKYDSEDKLILIVDSNNTNHQKHFTSFIYDSQGRWFKSVRSNDYNIHIGWDSIAYSHNKISERIFSNSIGYGFKNRYTYDAGGRLIADSVYAIGNSIVGYTSFSYDANDNVSSWQEYYYLQGTMQTNGVISVSYSSEINPYSSLGIPLYLITMYDITLISGHQKTQVVNYDGMNLNYTYEYYPDGLVKKMITQYHLGGISTTEFFYD